MIRSTFSLRPFDQLIVDLQTGATCSWDGKSLGVSFVLTGSDVDQIELPRRSAAPARRDGLWAHTCFELFMSAVDTERYFEFNFSPSGDWAAYQFSNYRAGQTPLPIAFDFQEWTQGADRVEFKTAFQPPVSLIDTARANLEFSPTAVIEKKTGEKSYWAARHSPPRPDFHLRQNFIRLDVPSQTKG